MHESSPYCAKQQAFAHKFKVEGWFIKTQRTIWWWNFLECFPFPEELYTLWWNLLLDQYGVSVLLKVVQTLTSMGYRFDMSISNRFCELVQDQAQTVHTVLFLQLSSPSTLGSNCRRYSILTVVVCFVCTKNVMSQNNCTIRVLFMWHHGSSLQWSHNIDGITMSHLTTWDITLRFVGIFPSPYAVICSNLQPSCDTPPLWQLYY